MNSNRDNDKSISSNSSRIDRSFKCQECKGFGHYQVECPNYLKKEDEEPNGNIIR